MAQNNLGIHYTRNLRHPHYDCELFAGKPRRTIQTSTSWLGKHLWVIISSANKAEATPTWSGASKSLSISMRDLRAPAPPASQPASPATHPVRSSCHSLCRPVIKSGSIVSWPSSALRKRKASWGLSTHARTPEITMGSELLGLESSFRLSKLLRPVFPCVRWKQNIMSSA